MKSVLFLSARLLSASPVVAQYNADNNCIRNKGSEMPRHERLYRTAHQQVLNPENMVEIARQMEQAGQLSKDLSQAEKNGIAYKLMTDQVTQMKMQIEVYKILPDCLEFQGGKGQ